MIFCSLNGFSPRPRFVALSRVHRYAVNAAPSSRTIASNSTKRKKLVSASKKISSYRVDVTGEELCDDILQRMSGYLTTNKPSTILDLCPGRGVLSLKIHEFIKPDRHILVEPRISHYKSHLKKLADKPGFELHGEKLHYDTLKGISWTNVFNKYMEGLKPEPGKNDLLILANMTDSSLNSPARIWAALVGHSLIDRGHFHDWSFRTLMVLPPEESQLLVPRTVKDRRKVAILTEAYARRSFFVAETDNNEHIASRELELATESAKLVAQRTAENNIVIPEGRQRPVLQSVTEIPTSIRSNVKTKFVPKTPVYAGYLAQVYAQVQKLYEDSDKSDPKSEALKKRRLDLSIARAQLFHHMKSVNEKIQLTKQQLAIDRMQEDIVKAKLDSTTDPATLDEMNSALIKARSELAKSLNNTVILVSRTLPNYVDDYRMALGGTGDIKDSKLVWDQRPFEPLYIKRQEVMPPGSDCSIMYVEPEPKQTLAERFAVDKAHERHDEAVEIALSVIGTFGIRGRDPVSDMLDKLFPGQKTGDIAKRVPALFPYIPKQLRSSSSSSSSTSTSSSTGNDAQPTIYDDFEYFPREVNIRSLPASVLLKLLKAYLDTLQSKTFLQVNRSLGGSATMYSLRSWVFDMQSKGD